MRILVTGSSGQIGTNLALRLLKDGHEVFGVDKRPNAWVGDAFPTLLQDLAGHYSAFPGGINGVEYPDVDLRCSNVYGRYDSDLWRMDRVLPLWMHQLSRGEPITIFGGDQKVLDFTYVDDCVDGIARGVYALAEGRAHNETVNLAYGQGNTLVRAAELIAEQLGVEPNVTIAPSLLGEVTHYVADVRKAHDVLGWSPTTSLDDGIPKAVAWFKEWRAAHPEEDRPFERPESSDELAHGFKEPARASAA